MEQLKLERIIKQKEEKIELYKSFFNNSFPITEVQKLKREIKELKGE
tara:strand:- start:526 stop:666 length:141 start_codon:yes stop_codon:yes gene_type:complete